MTDRAHDLLAGGRIQEALDLCRRTCQESRATAGEWELYGQLSGDQGDVVTARVALQKAIELDPERAGAQFALGKLLATCGAYPQAIERFQQAARIEPENADIWLALGITCGLAQQLPEAEEYCRRSLALQPGSADGHFNLANALQGQGRLAEAEVEYEAGLKINPGMVGGWSMLAQARFGLRKFAEAEAAAARALQLDPQMGEAHYTLGVIAATAGNNERARDCFRRAAALLPALPDAHLRLGQAHYSLNDYVQAGESFQTVVKLDPANVQAYYLLGQCLEERKLGDKAAACYGQVLALNPDHLQAHYCLAFICMRMDRHDEAANHFAEVLRINPDDEQARHLLAAQQGKTTATAPSAYVATLFDGFADKFDDKLVGELGYHTPEILHEMVSQVISPPPESLDVIDLGCGTGLCAPLVRPTARTLHGVDLSPRMIDRARERKLYDTLEVNDIVSSLEAGAAAWDLAIAADVFVYVGDLSAIFSACSAALKPGGVFAFSVEDGDDADSYVLRSTGRYAHASNYIRALAADTGFSEAGYRSAFLRRDKGQVEIKGHHFLLRRATELS